jgi:hypothetical protein
MEEEIWIEKKGPSFFDKDIWVHVVIYKDRSATVNYLNPNPPAFLIKH